MDQNLISYVKHKKKYIQFQQLFLDNRKNTGFFSLESFRLNLFINTLIYSLLFF